MADMESRLSGCLGAEEDQRPDGSTPERPSDVWSSFVQGHNDFALALYGQLLRQPGNVFFSPLSIRIALGMTRAGARDETAAQMDRALRFAFSDEKLHGAIAELSHTLNAAGGGAYEMTVANSLWGQDGEPFQSGFIEVVDRYYGGSVNAVDFRRDDEAARAKINEWVADKTRKKIEGLIPPGGLNPDTRLVLVNAVYFKGAWRVPFDEALTRDEPFCLEGGHTRQVPLMYHHQKRVRHLQTETYQAVDLDYQGGDLSMLVLLPDEREGLRDLEKTLSARLLDDCVAKMREREVMLFLPRFRMTWGTVELGGDLCALGMPIAFTPYEADFSGINGHTPPDDESLLIDGVFHKAFIKVNEEGTAAAAATGVVTRISVGMRTSPPVPVFRADHPFVFAIRHRKSGAILFFGRVADPTGSD